MNNTVKVFVFVDALGWEQGEKYDFLRDLLLLHPEAEQDYDCAQQGQEAEDARPAGGVLFGCDGDVQGGRFAPALVHVGIPHLQGIIPGFQGKEIDESQVADLQPFILTSLKPEREAYAFREVVFGYRKRDLEGVVGILQFDGRGAVVAHRKALRLL